MAIGDVWGNSWGSSWGVSWKQAVSPTPTVTAVGVRKSRKLNLSEIADKNRAAAYIKQQLALDRQRQEAQQRGAELAQKQATKKLSAKSRRKALEDAARIENAKLAAEQLEANNNAILSMILMSIQ